MEVLNRRRGNGSITKKCLCDELKRLPQADPRNPRVVLGQVRINSEATNSDERRYKPSSNRDGGGGKIGEVDPTRRLRKKE